jgi:hypothetical protein
MPQTNVSVADVLADLARVLRRLRLRWYVFVAQALVLRGLPRATADLDVTVLLGQRATTELSKALVAGGFSLRFSDAPKQPSPNAWGARQCPSRRPEISFS